MSESRPRRFGWWIGGGLVLAVVATLALFVNIRLQLSEDERLFVGRWSYPAHEINSEWDSYEIDFLPDGTMRTFIDGVLADSEQWAIHDGAIYIDTDPGGSTRGQRAWLRIIGSPPRGDNIVPFRIVSDDEVFLVGPNEPLKRVADSGSP